MNIFLWGIKEYVIFKFNLTAEENKYYCRVKKQLFKDFIFVKANSVFRNI